MNVLCCEKNVVLLCFLCLAGFASEVLAAPKGLYGTKRSAIFRGRLAKAADVYSSVVLVNADPANPNRSVAFCTGTLISLQVVVTAAHCFVREEGGRVVERTPADQFRVFVGQLNVNAMPYRDAIVVTKAIAHPNYPNSAVPKNDLDIGREDDVAILLLAEPVSSVPIAPILSAAQFTKEMKAGAKIVVNGYGNTGPNKEDGGVLHVGEMPFQEALDFEFWSGGATVTDTCPGDSGGPAYFKLGGKTYLAGIGLRGIDRGETRCGEGAIFARAHIYLDWIKSSAEGLFDPNAKPPTGCACSTNQKAPASMPLSLLLLFVFFASRLRASRRSSGAFKS